MSPAGEKVAAAVLLFLLMRLSFVAIGSVVASDPQVAPDWLATSLDARLPVVPAAVWPYLSWYPATLLFLLMPQRQFRHAAVAIALAYTLCAVGYLTWPVSIVRPVPAGHTLSERVLLHLYSNDPPWNIFPASMRRCARSCAPYG